MSAPEPLDGLLRTLEELGKTGVPVEEPQRAAYRRERIVRLLGSTIASEGRRGRRRIWPWVAAAGVALALGGTGTWARLHTSSSGAAFAAATAAGQTRAISGDVTVRRLGRTSSLREGDVLVGGEVVSTAARAVAEIGIASGRARLGSASELELVRPTPTERRLRLGAGTVDVDLPQKLGPGKHLVVETPNVDVLVVGTAFTVDVVREQDRPLTHVRVRRGTVWIMHAGQQRAVLRAGDDWSSAALAKAATPAAAPIPAPSVTSRAVAARVAPRRALLSARSGAPARAPVSSTLDDENRLFQAGISARNAGDSARAADAFATLLARYPRTVLREQALAEEFRALNRAGRSSAATIAARRYLASYPNGFARVEAERVTDTLSGAR